MIPRDEEREQRVETMARVLHSERHLLGTAAVCGRCRELAQRLASILLDG